MCTQLPARWCVWLLNLLISLSAFIDAVCSCNVGYDLQPDHKSCVYNNCFLSNGGCSQICLPDGNFNVDLYFILNDLVGGACACNAGYDLQADGKSCTYNNCYINNNGCNHTCHADGKTAISKSNDSSNHDSFFLVGTCSCRVGYDLQPDGKTCKINYCLVNNGGCTQTCTPPGNVLSDYNALVWFF